MGAGPAVFNGLTSVCVSAVGLSMSFERTEKWRLARDKMGTFYELVRRAVIAVFHFILLPHCNGACNVAAQSRNAALDESFATRQGTEANALLNVW